MTNIDMVEAVRMLAADRGIPVDTLLQVLADALVTAYKRRPDAADEAEVQIDAETMDIRIFAYDIDEFGELVNGRDVRRVTPFGQASCAKTEACPRALHR